MRGLADRARGRTPFLLLAAFSLVLTACAHHALGAAGDAAGDDPGEATDVRPWIYLVELAAPPPGGSTGRGAGATAGDDGEPPEIRRVAAPFGCGDRLVAVRWPDESEGASSESVGSGSDEEGGERGDDRREAASDEAGSSGDEGEVGNTGSVPQPAAATPSESDPQQRLSRRVGEALDRLLALESPPPGLYDALGRSRLSVASVEPVPALEGTFRVRLSGRLRLGGTCDTPRVRAQLEATATQFEAVTEVELFVGEEPLDALLTARGAAPGSP